MHVVAIACRNFRDLTFSDVPSPGRPPSAAKAIHLVFCVLCSGCVCHVSRLPMPRPLRAVNYLFPLLHTHLHQDESVIPPSLAKALDRVRQGADMMPTRQLHRQLEKSLGVGWRSRLAHFDETPIAAASIGQVRFCWPSRGSSGCLRFFTLFQCPAGVRMQGARVASSGIAGVGI